MDTNEDKLSMVLEMCQGFVGRFEALEQGQRAISDELTKLGHRVAEVELRQRAFGANSHAVNSSQLDARDYRNQVSPYSLSATHRDAVDIPFYMK